MNNTSQPSKLSFFSAEKYSHGDHTGKLVPIYAYGVGTEIFDGQTIENVQIPKTIAKMWGQSLAADTNGEYPPLG